MNRNEVFAKNFTRILEERGKTQRDIAELCGITEGAVSMWANGTTCPKYANQLLLSNYLHCSISDLMMESVEPETAYERELLTFFRMVPDENKQMVINMVKAAAKQ